MDEDNASGLGADDAMNESMEVEASEEITNESESGRNARKWKKFKENRKLKKQTESNKKVDEVTHPVVDVGQKKKSKSNKKRGKVVDGGQSGVQQDVYLPGNEEIDENIRPEDLECDESAYVLFHRAHTGAPCLSFDILEDQLGNNRESYPMTQYIVCGTQAEKSHLNQVITMKLCNLHQNKQRDSDDSDSESDEDEDKMPELHPAAAQHSLGAVNRIRATRLNETPYAASWCERGVVFIWDLTAQLKAVEDIDSAERFSTLSANVKPVFEFSGHGVEGFAMDWSLLSPGQLLTGDCSKNIHLWKPVEGGRWAVNQRAYMAHSHSVEDIQWSPTESTVFASCSVDKSIRIWDIRASPSKANMLTTNEAHRRDVNVISWNRTEPFIISGGDDALIKIWDLRMFQTGHAVAQFDHHKGPITSVEWHPSDSSVFAAAGEDDQVTLWDLAVEKDEEADDSIGDIPPQLLFIHQGQSDVKEIHWHKQCPGVLISTASSGINIFRTISV